MKSRLHPIFSRGFTLVELMIVVVIVSILLAVTVPSYQRQVRKSRRTEAKTAILDLAGREERFLSTAANGANYSAVATDLGYPAGAWPQAVGSGYYNVTVCTVNSGAAGACAPSALPGPSFTITAVPVGTQATDTECQTFAVDSAGQQLVTGAPTQTAAYCWAN